MEVIELINSKNIALIIKSKTARCDPRLLRVADIHSFITDDGLVALWERLHVLFESGESHFLLVTLFVVLVTEEDIGLYRLVSNPGSLGDQ